MNNTRPKLKKTKKPTGNIFQQQPAGMGMPYVLNGNALCLELECLALGMGMSCSWNGNAFFVCNLLCCCNSPRSASEVASLLVFFPGKCEVNRSRQHLRM